MKTTWNRPLGGALAALAMTLAPTASLAGPSGTVLSNNLRDADGSSGQDSTKGAGVKTPHLQNGAVTAQKLAGNAVGTAAIADGAVTSAKLAGAIPASKLNRTGLDADLLDGRHATDFSLKLHSHGTSEILDIGSWLFPRQVMYPGDVFVPPLSVTALNASGVPQVGVDLGWFRADGMLKPGLGVTAATLEEAAHIHSTSAPVPDLGYGVFQVHVDAYSEHAEVEAYTPTAAGFALIATAEEGSLTLQSSEGTYVKSWVVGGSPRYFIQSTGPVDVDAPQHRLAPSTYPGQTAGTRVDENGASVFLTSPNGTVWKLTVSDSGALSVSPASFTP